MIQEKWNKVDEICSDKQEIYTDDFTLVLCLSFDEDKNCTAVFIGTGCKNVFDDLLNDLNIDWSYISSED